MPNSFFNNIPPVTKNLIIINFILWLATNVLANRGLFDLNANFGLHYWAADNFNPAQLLTYMFLHGSFEHIFFNMFALFMFGMVIENFFGTKRFIIYYLVCGIGAGIVQEIFWTIQFQPILNEMTQAIESGIYSNTAEIINSKADFLANPNLITIGASGAVFGILLAFGWFFPHQKIYIYFLIPVSARIFVIIYAVLEMFFGVANFSGDNVAHFAHLGGALFGLILILLWRRKTPKIDYQ